MEAENTKKLWESARDGNLEEVTRLLGLGNVNINWENPDAYGESPLIVASRNGNLPVVRALLDAGADVNQVEGGGATAIYWAAFQGDTEIIKLLLEKGADPDIAKKDGYTPLLIAKGRGQNQAMILLLNRGADVNKADNKGRTLLNWASSTGNSKWVNFFLKKGADVNQKDNKGNTAISLAANEDIRNLLKEYDKRNKTILMRKMYNTTQDKGGLELGDTGLDVNSEIDLHQYLGGLKRRRTKKRRTKRRKTNKKKSKRRRL
jgi:ankyrin repeat protein